MKKVIFALIVICIGAEMILNQDTVRTAVSEAISNCLSTVIPSLFPFMIVSSVITEMFWVRQNGFCARLFNKIFGVSASSAVPIILGATAGIPVGAVTCRELYSNGRISAHEAEYLLSFCSNSGISFVTGIVGGTVFGDVKMGVLIYVIQTVSSFCVGIILKKKGGYSVYSDEVSEYKQMANLSQAVVKSVRNAVINTANVCGFITAFAVITAILCKLTAESFTFPIKAVFEVTGALLELDNSTEVISPVIVSGLLSWSGISVHMQVRSVTSGLSMKLYYIGKAVHMAISMLLTYIVTSGGTLATYKESVNVVTRSGNYGIVIIFAIFISIFCCIFCDNGVKYKKNKNVR